MIYNYFLDLVRYYDPEDTIEEFRKLFFEFECHSENEEAFKDLEQILKHQDPREFINTLKRCCYILINNWETLRQSEAIRKFVKGFQEVDFDPKSVRNRNKIRLKSYLKSFVESKDYEELLLFTEKHGTRSKQEKHWSERYTSYLLVPQYADTNNSPEQREAARTLSVELKQKFKFDLAMFTARSQSQSVPKDKLKNPTGLGEEILNLIKRIVAKRGKFSYTNLAHIFCKQTEGVPYNKFKEALLSYLVYSVEKHTNTELLKTHLKRKLEKLYNKYNDKIINESLLLRTCNQVISFLTTEDGENPSETFIYLLSQGTPLTLVIVLLKLILICPNARTHLETCIAHLIEYYREFPEDECQWVINFFEIFNITFAIYADNDVQYDLIRVEKKRKNQQSSQSDQDDLTDDYLENYRIFSQHRGEDPTQLQFANLNMNDFKFSG
ncbi:hypothetical protein PN462_20375 [Spirulina sp. CS-785/01]|uniref:hypothetical protein n=1 Tax=Spirulina sp. CS-785/01 TaxID=3021716 RepID=UPI00232FED67|nr:hypothetical protein [Spirulina sp. CS-785/01]MDB9315481.1 hypothetical protein [Spirulina sp. CS-785/01]